MLKTLKNVSIFRNFNTEQYNFLFNLMTKKSYKEGEIIIQQGEYDKTLYIVLDGSVQVLKEDATGKLCEIGHLLQGRYFGEISLITEGPRTASVMAYQDSTLLTLSKLGYNELCIKFPGIELQMVKQLLFDTMTKLRQTSETAESIEGLKNKYFYDMDQWG